MLFHIPRMDDPVCLWGNRWMVPDKAGEAMTDTLRRYEQVFAVVIPCEGTSGDSPSRITLQLPEPATLIDAADVDRLMTVQADGYQGERTACTLVPKQGKPISLNLPAPLVQFILELDRMVGEKDKEIDEAVNLYNQEAERGIKCRDEFMKENARCTQLSQQLAAKEAEGFDYKGGKVVLHETGKE